MDREKRKPWVPTREDIEAVARDIAEKFQPQRIILFGSYAYGTPTDDSDVDLLVVMDTDEDPISIAGRILSQTVPGCLLDVLVRTPEELQRRIEWGDCFLRDIVAKGEVLYERTDAGVAAEGSG